MFYFRHSRLFSIKNLYYTNIICELKRPPWDWILHQISTLHIAPGNVIFHSMHI
ncbi:Hypothetical protein CINCED_3A023414 [Cinara cedri]|uniref:Uncharacterized protein n=1 Tax=Cinara cedri TaxID=506608 RepID=A0A5E4NQY7_9HEMI|nr:Hypothetical protein CINCED_3A023414 [Cinara cedri]